MCSTAVAAGEGMTMWMQACAHALGVVPAKAGTYNHREKFGEDSWSGL